MGETAAAAPRTASWLHWTEPQQLDVDGLATAYRVSGEGEAVVFLHGLHFTRVWLPFYGELARNCEVTVPEHPGFGGTPLPATLRSMEDVVLHYEAFFRQRGLDRVHLVGHGLGGWMAANIAIHHPERIASLTLITPSGVRLESGNGLDRFRLLEDELRAAYFNGREDAFTEYFEQEGPVEDALQRDVEGRAHALLTWNPRYDWRLDHRLRRITAPTLVIGVEDDRYVPTASGERYAELITGAKYERVSGSFGAPSSHMALVEQPGDVAMIVREHIAASAAGAR